MFSYFRPTHCAYVVYKLLDVAVGTVSTTEDFLLNTKPQVSFYFSSYQGLPLFQLPIVWIYCTIMPPSPPPPSTSYPHSCCCAVPHKFEAFYVSPSIGRSVLTVPPPTAIFVLFCGQRDLLQVGASNGNKFRNITEWVIFLPKLHECASGTENLKLTKVKRSWWKCCQGWKYVAEESITQNTY